MKRTMPKPGPAPIHQSPGDCQSVHAETAIFRAMRMRKMRIGFPVSLACGVALVAGVKYHIQVDNK
jgi:hypothetical protein